MQGREPAFELAECGAAVQDLRARMQSDKPVMQLLQLVAGRRERSLSACVQRHRVAIEVLTCAIEYVVQLAIEPAPLFPQDLGNRLPVGDGELGCSGRRRRTGIGREVREGQIDFMTDRRDHRHGTARDRPHDALVIEGGQIRHRAAAPPDDHDVDARSHDHRHPLHDLVRRRLALHRCIGDQDRRRQPTLHGANDVVYRGARFRSFRAGSAS